MQFIINTQINMNKEKENNIILNCNSSKEDIENLISEKIYYIRKKYQEFKEIDINKEIFLNKCDLFQAIVFYIFQDLGFKVIPIETNKVISDDVLGHSLALIEYNNYKYLVDLTYKQFFLKQNCDKEKYFIKNDYILLAPHPGYYYLEHPEHLDIAQELLNEGFIEATPLNLKVYFDSFYLTRRGRIYNKENTFESNINSSAYLNALKTYSGNVHYSKEDLFWLDLNNNKRAR